MLKLNLIVSAAALLLGTASFAQGAAKFTPDAEAYDFIAHLQSRDGAQGRSFAGRDEVTRELARAIAAGEMTPSNEAWNGPTGVAPSGAQGRSFGLTREAVLADLADAKASGWMNRVKQGYLDR